MANIPLMIKAKRGADLSQIAADLKGVGFEVERLLPRTGIIQGSVASSNLAAVEALPEVKFVRRSGYMRAFNE